MVALEQDSLGARAQGVARGAPEADEIELSIIIPTRNEAEGVAALLDRVSAAITTSAEVLFVDDSDDATPFAVRRLVDQGRYGTLPVGLVHRPEGIRDGGLGGAVVEGLRRARGTWVCVMDADLQHPPETINDLLAEALSRNVDLVIGTRYAEGATESGLSAARKAMSKACATAAKGLFPSRMRQVTDPMSGFFLLRRDKVDPSALRPNGFKILLEILGRYPELTVGEVGYHFHERYAGLSKASAKEARRFATQLATLRFTDTRKRAESAARMFQYDIHGIASVVSEHRLPELDKFRVRAVDGPPTVRVRVKDFKERRNGELIDLSQARPKVLYRESLGRSGFCAEVEVGTTTEVKVSELVASSPHVLYTNVVEPILRWKLVELGYALVHAACFADGDDAYLVTARTDTGKTTTMLKVLDRSDYSFLSDDLVLIDHTGRVLTYPKPLTISAHTVHALKSAELAFIERLALPFQSRIHSRSGRRFAFLLTSKKLPVASINAIVQRIVPPPKYHVERLVPGLSLGTTAKVRGMFIIERSNEDRMFEVEAGEALEILLENCEDAYGFPPYDALVKLLHGMSDIDLKATERSIIAQALEGRETRVVRSSNLGWAVDIHDVVSNGLLRDDVVVDLRALERDDGSGEEHEIGSAHVAEIVVSNGSNGHHTNGNGAAR